MTTASLLQLRVFGLAVRPRNQPGRTLGRRNSGTALKLDKPFHSPHYRCNPVAHSIDEMLRIKGLQRLFPPIAKDSVGDANQI
jgi:hypothetical protein